MSRKTLSAVVSAIELCYNRCSHDYYKVIFSNYWLGTGVFFILYIQRWTEITQLLYIKLEKHLMSNIMSFKKVVFIVICIDLIFK